MIGRVVTAIDYRSIQFSIRLAVAIALTTRLSFVPMAVSFLTALHNTKMHRSMRGVQLDFRIGSPKSVPACLK